MQTPQVIFLTFCGLLLLTGLNTSPAPLLRHFIPVHNQLNIPFNKEQTSTNAATVHWYDQRVDHFNPADTRTFKARYLENSEFYRAGGPVFLIFGGQYEVPEIFLEKNGGYYVDLAERYNALLLCNEHRFYGQTQPFNDTKNESLQYLSLDQVMADTAAFIRYFKSSRPEFANAKIILLGFSYSGGLSTWFQHVNPGLVDGVWSSSGVVFPSADNDQYNVAAGEAYRVIGGQNCYNAFKNGFTELEMRIDSGTSAKEIEEAFNLCDPMDTSNKLDMQHFIATIGSQASSLTQLLPVENYPAICNIMTDPAYESRFYALAGLIRFINGEQCLSVKYRDSVEYFSKTDLNDPVNFGERQFFYTRCTEFGWFLTTTSSESQPFGTKATLDYFAQFCSDVFGRPTTTADLVSNARRTSIRFGADRGVYSRVITTHGEFDPWMPVGLLQDRTGDSPVYVTKNHTHCEDVVYPIEFSPPGLQPARDLVNQWISRWIA